MSPIPHSWRWHIPSNMVFILAFLNYSLLLLFFFSQIHAKVLLPKLPASIVSYLQFFISCSSQGSHMKLKAEEWRSLPKKSMALRVPQLQDLSKNTLWELLPKQKELRSKGEEEKPNHEAAASQGLSRRGGRAVLALNWPIPTFSHHPKSRFYEEFTTLHMATASAEHV